MIRKFRNNDFKTIMQIWLDTNIQTHTFISENYWKDNFDTVKNMLPRAELYVYEDDYTNQIDGFIGLMGDYIAGIFIKEFAQSNGIGKQLLDYVKTLKSKLSLSVYQKNTRAIRFYQRESFVIQSENTDENTKEKEFIMIWGEQ
ncbi:MAG: N-acetyltransferase [Lachnospiraceae bacterium]|nr:N-acetyltransferase [Lachnospiraceae bacterium]MDE6186086.1 N-acetyltransferase [Lachnospiraceae bacterium]